VDGRSAESRRFRDLVSAYADELGGVGEITEAQRALVTQAASVQLSAEALQSRIVRGDVVDADELVRVGNVLARLMAAIGIKKGSKAADGVADLHRYLVEIAEADDVEGAAP
jgi:hypothetical protein